MTASRLIELLGEAIARDGDLEVRIIYDGSHDEIDEASDPDRFRYLKTVVADCPGCAPEDAQEQFRANKVFEL